MTHSSTLNVQSFNLAAPRKCDLGRRVTRIRVQSLPLVIHAQAVDLVLERLGRIRGRGDDGAARVELEHEATIFWWTAGEEEQVVVQVKDRREGEPEEAVICVRLELVRLLVDVECRTTDGPSSCLR